MPTSIPALTVPAPLSRPCDFAAEWCAFTGQINTIFDRWEASLARSFPSAPGAMMQMSATVAAPVLVTNFNPVPFDTVGFDNAGLTDMDADPYTILVNRTGRYTLGAFVWQVSPGVVNAKMLIEIQAPGVLPQSAFDSIILDRTGVIPYSNNVHWEVATVTAGTKIRLTVFNPVSAPAQVVQAWLGVYWHADLEVP